MKRPWSIAYGHEKEHAKALKRGLALMPSGFIAEICSLCEGEGQYMQSYTNGCGGGYSRMRGGCDFCNSTGLLQGCAAAPDSVRNQVLVAASAPNWKPKASVTR